MPCFPSLSTALSVSRHDITPPRGCKLIKQAVAKTALRDREQQFARYRQLMGIADNEGLKEFRIVKIDPGGHHPLAEFRVVEKQGLKLMRVFSRVIVGP